MAESYGLVGNIYLQRNDTRLARENYERAQSIFTELKTAGKLIADYLNEPDRLAAILNKLKGVS